MRRRSCIARQEGSCGLGRSGPGGAGRGTGPMRGSVGGEEASSGIAVVVGRVGERVLFWMALVLAYCYCMIFGVVVEVFRKVFRKVLLKCY